MTETNMVILIAWNIVEFVSSIQGKLAFFPLENLFP